LGQSPLRFHPLGSGTVSIIYAQFKSQRIFSAIHLEGKELESLMTFQGQIGEPRCRPPRGTYCHLSSTGFVWGFSRAELETDRLEPVLLRAEDLNMLKTLSFWAAGIAATLLLCSKFLCPAQAVAAQGRGAALPAAADLVRGGTHFLVRLDEEMNTGKDKVSKKFEVTTIEPLETLNGYVLPPGARIVGHISRIEPGGLTGHARLWLTFDDIDTHRGVLPIVAEVSSVPANTASGKARAKRGKSKRTPTREHRCSKPRPLARPRAARQESPLTMPKQRPPAQQRVELPHFWRPRESARNSICRKARNWSSSSSGHCILVGDNLNAIGKH